MRRRQVGRAALAAAIALMVAGCGGQEGPDVPEDAVRLVANQPVSVDGTVVTAYHIREDSAKILVRIGEEAETATVDVGSHAEALGFAFRLVAVSVDVGDDDVPGGDRSVAWIVAESAA
ncbi:hypothetical protein [Cellulomonas xiejunii]|uniref:Uncharacterized protein n=1 Tax=Cellulomonas xiejunii TaxID=2968083 RepID=A0ABY5KKH5_9CELL|nr:hypothetical protein [Cellulomonas xiejunii]MCC2312625.1 hypothetical protein [Cellulomonas xiejunii]MCC2320505.1 hypothetical protein [Cellulomonas xiejunii]UUI70799.1 hypothetical protein NP048_13475 [Cellulomonas xiejunii]